MPTPARFDLSGFIEKISPKGAYFKYARAAVIGLGAIVLILAGFLLYPTVKNLFVKPPAPVKVTNFACDHSKAGKLPTGFQSWGFSYADSVKGPKIGTATIDTLTPPMGSTQTLTLTIKSQSPVTSAQTYVYTDNNSQQYDLKLTKGSATDGTWVGIWRLNDTTDCIYHIDFDLKSSTGDWTGALTFR